MDTLILYLIISIIMSLFAAIIGFYLHRKQSNKNKHHDRKQSSYPSLENNKNVSSLLNNGEHENIIQDQVNMIGRLVTIEVKEVLKNELKEYTEWAVGLLENLNLFPHIKSLFWDRIKHFPEEKEHVAENFVSFLLSRCEWLINSKNKKVYLLIDSGTTLFPFFSLIAKQAVDKRNSDRGKWLDGLNIVTNNLQGIISLMQDGLLNPAARYTELALNCQILPGEPLPIYSAVTGEQTVEALNILREKVGDKGIFIGLVTGNWIRLGSNPVRPIPLARGRGHKPFKDALINNCDEIYVVTPLGKIFCDVTLDVLNDALGFSYDHEDPDSRSYEEVYIPMDKLPCIKMVSTFRREHRLLTPLSHKVKKLLNIQRVMSPVAVDFLKNKDINEIPHLIFPFDSEKFKDTELQMETEFPHLNTRDKEFMKTYFFVQDSDLPEPFILDKKKSEIF